MLNREEDINIFVVSIIEIYDILSISTQIIAIMPKYFVHFELSYGLPMFW